MTVKKLPRALAPYIILLLAAAVAAFAHQAGREPLHLFQPDGLSVARLLSLFLYMGLAAVAATISVPIPYTTVRFSMDTAFVFAILLIFGPLEAMIADAIAKAVNTCKEVPNLRTNWFKIPFNMASGMLAVFAAGVVYRALLPVNPSYGQYVAPLAWMTMAYFLVNSWTVALAIGIAMSANVGKVWAMDFLWTGVGNFACLSIAVLIDALDSKTHGLAFLVSLPLVALIYLSQRIYTKRETELQRRVAELQEQANQLAVSRNEVAGAVALAARLMKQRIYTVERIMEDLATYAALIGGDATAVRWRETRDCRQFLRGAVDGALPPEAVPAVSLVCPHELREASLPFAALEKIVRNMVHLAALSSTPCVKIEAMHGAADAADAEPVATPAPTGAELLLSLGFGWVGARGVDNLDFVDAPFRLLSYWPDEYRDDVRVNLEQLVCMAMSKKLAELSRGRLSYRVEELEPAKYVYDIQLIYRCGRSPA